MSEFLAGAKLSLIAGSFVGSVVSMSFINMPLKKRIAAVGSGMAVSYSIGDHVAGLVHLPPYPTGFLLGLFGVSICKLIFDSLQKSDLSFNLATIIDAIKSMRGQ